MTQQELDALKALANAATPGPWRVAEYNTVAADGRRILKCRDQYDGVRLAVHDNAKADAAFIAASREAVPALLDALAAANARAEAAERRAMVAERRLAAGPAAVALKHIDDYGRAQWVNGREAKFRISYAEWWKLMVELGEVQP